MTNTTDRDPHQVVEVPATPSRGGSDIEGRLSSIESQMQHLATKAELAELRGDMNEGFAELRGELNQGLLNVRLWVLGGLLGGLPICLSLAAFLFDK